MIRYEGGVLIAGQNMPAFKYIPGSTLLGRFVLPVTRRLRTVNALRYCVRGSAHLDIGCGDGYFLKRSPCETAFGIDMRLGDPPLDPPHQLPFPDESFDLVTMLAVIEHVKDPAYGIAEITRVLKPGGRLVLTTPKRAAEWLIKLYVRDIHDEHEFYFTEASLQKLVTGKLTPVAYKPFLLGLNQAFAAEKSSMS